MTIAPGATSQSITVYAYDATTGLPYTTAAYNDAGIALWYRRGGVGAKTTITPATLSALTDAYSSGGFKAVAENAYRLDLPDAAIAAGVDRVEVGGSATAWKLIPLTIELETPQTGDSYARIGANGAGLTAVGDTSGTTTLLSRLSSARAGYLDNLSAGAVALASALSSAASDITTLLSRLTSTRAGYLDNLSAAPPTAGTIADAVWDEALSGHATAGTAGHYLTDAGSGADPMENAASGYASGTLGYIISRLTSARVTVSSLLTSSGDISEIVAGADYNATDGTAFDWTESTGAWPTLTGATVVWHGQAGDGSTQSFSMTVTDGEGATKTVRLALTAAQTQALADAATGIWTFAVWATLATSGRKVRLVRGSAPVVDGPGPS